MGKKKLNHLVSLYDWEKKDLEKVLKRAEELKKKQKKGVKHELLKGKTLGMLFEKPSTRTRVSFETGMFQLGGHALYLGKNDLQLGRGETVDDTGVVLSRYVDGIMARVLNHRTLMHLARVSSVPVINGLSDFNHPCQVLADLLTIKEKKKKLKGLKVAYVGDGNNVCHSLMYAAGHFDMDLWIATPMQFQPEKGVVIEADKMSLGACELTTDPMEAVQDADVVYTDTWVSMGDEKFAARKKRLLKPFQVNVSLARLADPDHLFMHCLPAHRGEEVTGSIIDGPNSVVFDQAENRLHAQKGLLSLLLK